MYFQGGMAVLRTSSFIFIIATIILSLNNLSPENKGIDQSNVTRVDQEVFSVDNPSVHMGNIIGVLSEDIQKKKAEELDIVEEVDVIVVEAPNKVDTPALNNIPADSLNKFVLDTIKTYKIGSYPYLLNNDYENYNGVTENLYYQGELLLKAEPNGSKASNCTGITFEVFYKAMQQRNKALGLSPEDINGMTKDELFDMALIWFAAMGPKSQSNIAVAVEKYDLGNRITNLEELRAGDFIDFSRENNTGHAVVFLEWIREGDRIIGFKFWSSQGSTHGINYKEEYFNIKNSNGQKYGNVIIENLHMARIIPN